MKEILRQLRTDNRYSQETLAKALGISRQAYMKYESGEVEPPLHIIRRLSRMFHVSYETLIDGRNADITYAPFTPQDYGTVAVNDVYPAYSAGKNQMQMLTTLTETLTRLQNVMSAVQTQVTALTNQQETGSTAKSRSFNKAEFFEKIGTVHIDSSYVDDLRKDSLI